MTMLSNSTIASFLVIAIIFLIKTLRRSRNNTLGEISGPPPGSWLVGNIPELLRPTNVGDADFAWTDTYGTSLRIKGIFGRDVLFTTDPKSFQYILATSCYDFPKLPEFRFLVSLFTGKGLAWAEGAQHSRHRKVMDPAFTSGSVKRYCPQFRQTIQQTVAKWRDIITESGSVSSQIDIIPWMDRTTLDMIGSTAFDYDFGALEENDNELYLAYSGLMAYAFLQRSDFTFAFEALCGILPGWLLWILLAVVPDKNIAKVQNYMAIARRVGRTLVNQRVDSYMKREEGSQDILSTLVHENLSSPLRIKLTEEEILAQVTTLIIAGHETTACAVSWALYELSRNLSFQHELRQEIKDMRARMNMRGETEFTAADYDEMKLLGATLKETLRYHPILPQLSRIAGRDDVIPLSTPYRTKKGYLITGIPVSKGQGIILSVAAFNRLPAFWGDDADLWRPQRFIEDIEGKPKTGLGVISNLITFSAGTRTCVGWRFAMLEMQVMLVELIENFEFSLSPEVEILRGATATMSPILKGSREARAELPLIIKSVL